MIPVLGTVENFFENAGIIVIVGIACYLIGWALPPSKWPPPFKRN